MAVARTAVATGLIGALLALAGAGLGRAADGDPIQLAPRVGALPLNQLFDRVPRDIAATVTGNANLVGLTHVHVRVLDVLQGGVIVITARADGAGFTPDTFDAVGGLGTLLGTDDLNRYEGVFVRIVDGSGKPLLIGGSAPRNGGGVHWTSPKFGPEGDDA